MVDISNTIHACMMFFSSVFGLAGNANKPIVGFARRSGICHEQSFHAWWSECRDYLHQEWTLVSAEGSGWQNAVDPCLEIVT